MTDSEAWHDFLKIRKSAEKNIIVSYVQCKNCKGLLYFPESSGTSHLWRHTCKATAAVAQKGSDYVKLSAEKIAEVKVPVLQSAIKLCAEEFIHTDLISRTGFLRFAQSFVSLGSKLGNINVAEIYPNSNTINRRIAHIKDETLRSIYTNFREAIKNDYCSATFEIIGSNNDNLFLTMGIQYFEKELNAITKKLIFTTSIDKTDNPENVRFKLIQNFNIFGGDENDLRRIKIVTPYNETLIAVFDSQYSRVDCIADKITKMLDTAFKKSINVEIDELLSNARSIARLAVDEIPNIHLDNATWKSKLLMLQPLIQHYDTITNILENQNKIDLKINKRKAEEMVSFLEPFVEAIDDLSETTYPTCNKILLWWAILNEHIKTCENYSFELKRIFLNMKECYKNEFDPTMENKVNCLLDPRYKILKMLPERERQDVYKNVRDLMKDVVVDQTDNVAVNISEAPPPNKKQKFLNYEASRADILAMSKPTTTVKKNRFSTYETSESDTKEKDELGTYLKLPAINSDNFENEIDVVGKFWKCNKEKLPKLFKLATTRLHVPACCGKTELLKTDLQSKCLEDFMLIRDNLSILW